MEKHNFKNFKLLILFLIISNSLCSQNKTIVPKNEINKAFRILFSVICVMPIIALTIETFKKPNDILLFILIGIGQILMIRYFFIGLFFSRMSKRSLNRLRDVLDIEYKE